MHAGGYSDERVAIVEQNILVPATSPQLGMFGDGKYGGDLHFTIGSVINNL